MARWRMADMPDLTGRRAIVTGGNVGLGYRVTLELARRGAGITIGCRGGDSAAAAIARIEAAVPGARVSFVPLDLTDAGSIAAFVQAYRDRHDRLDLLVNNGGAVLLDSLQRTADGRELHMATNHFGHFALTCRLFDLLCRTTGARVVTVSSGLYRAGEIRFDDLDRRQRPYSPRGAYGDSKLANLLFTHTLQRRFAAAGCDARSVAAHPGLTGTDRQQGRPRLAGRIGRLIASPIETGVAPLLRAATDPAVRGGECYGPRYFLRGPAVRETLRPEATDDAVAERLWAASEAATGCRFAHVTDAADRA